MNDSQTNPATQTNPSTNGFPATRLRRGMAALAHDATSIAELQVQLVALDLKGGSKHVRNAAILAVIAGVVLLACVPIGMIGVAELLVLAGLPRWVSYLATGAAGLVIGLLLLWGCWVAVRKTAAAFGRSREELSKNVEWFKQTLRRG